MALQRKEVFLKFKFNADPFPQFSRMDTQQTKLSNSRS